jgi:YHS domain-containing protein
MRRLACPWILVSLIVTTTPLSLAQNKTETPVSNAPASVWQKVENSKVCMVTDMVFPRAQIPVKVGDKTYYGCCDNCKQRLTEDEKVRSATDPVSGKLVDKAKAVIAANAEDGSVLYFESDTNLQAFVKKKK